MNRYLSITDIFLEKKTVNKLEIKFEKLIEVIVREVLEELLKIGVKVDYSSELKKNTCSCNNTNKNLYREILNFNGYRTAVLTEKQLLSLKPETVEIVIPKETVFTPGAREIIKKRKLIISYN